AVCDVLHRAVGANARARVEEIERRVIRQQGRATVLGRLLGLLSFHITSPSPINIYFTGDELQPICRSSQPRMETDPMTPTSRRHAMTASLGLALTGAALARSTPVRAEQAPTAEQIRTHHKTVQIDGLKLFYREAGSPAAPTLLLLHGFPTSSHMF